MSKQTEFLLNLHRLLEPKQVSEILGVTAGTLQIWRSTGRYDLPFVKCGGRVMYSPEDVQAFIKRRTMAHTA
jgi:predicted site-specific integrase-resolvase